MTMQPDPMKALLIPCEKYSYYIECVHADFLGPIKGKVKSVIMDACSKWSNCTVEKF